MINKKGARVSPYSTPLVYYYCCHWISIKIDYQYTLDERRSFHFLISVMTFSEDLSTIIPMPPTEALFELRHAELIIRVKLPIFSYRILSV